MSFVDREHIRELLLRAGLGDAPPKRVAALGAVVLVVCGLGVWRFWPASPAPEVRFHDERPPEASAETTTPVAADVVVHVAGAVLTPGVYRLPAGSRVTDAVNAAGGSRGDAALDSVNLARILIDGEQVYLPSAEEAAAGIVAPPVGAGGGGASAVTGALVDLNTASVADLDALPGIGEATAKKIVADREKNGPFAAPEDLMRVSGIGEKKFESLKDLVTVR